MTGPAGLIIAPMTPDDWPAVRRIYAEGIATGNATFETETPTWETLGSQPPVRLSIDRAGRRCSGGVGCHFTGFGSPMLRRGR